MKTITQTANTSVSEREGTDFAVDTTFVLFFLGIEVGRTLNFAAFDTLFLVLTLFVLAIAPYLLSNSEKIDFKSWVAGRLTIAAFAVLLGWAFNQSLGVVIPDMLRYMPMTLLIVTAMLCCYIQFYGFLKLRYVK